MIPSFRARRSSPSNSCGVDVAVCDVCGEGFRGGSANVGKWTFCTHQCRDRGKALQALEEYSDSVIWNQIQKARNGSCPECGQAGQLDVHKSHRAHSVVIWTTWQSHLHMCCKSCARSHQWKAIGYTAALGWWGVPWGFIASPIQIGRNLVAMMCRTDQPSSLSHRRLPLRRHRGRGL